MRKTKEYISDVQQKIIGELELWNCPYHVIIGLYMQNISYEKIGLGIDSDVPIRFDFDSQALDSIRFSIF